MSVITFSIDSRTIKRVKLISKCGYQSATRCSNSLHMHLGSSGVLTPLKIFVKVSSAGFGAFGKMKCLFSIAPDAKFLVVGTFEQG